MISIRYALLPAIAAALFLISDRSIMAAEADRVDARFEIFGLAGLHVLTNRTTSRKRRTDTRLQWLSIRVASPAYLSISEVAPRVTGVSAETSPTPLSTAPICAETAPIVITASITAATVP